MREVRVVLNDAVPSRDGDLPVHLAGPEPTFDLRVERIERRLSARLEDLPLDLLEIAAGVFAADSSTSRGGSVRRDFGADWRRSFRFVCPVRRPDFWRRPDVVEALESAVSFLTDDAVTFEFVEGSAPPPAQDYLPFHDDEEGPLADEVLLFSGGLDSLAGAVERLKESDARIALVSHKAARKVARRQQDLVAALQDDFPGRVRWVPVEATLKGYEATSTTQRSRSFLFAALGFAVARMVGAERVDFFENGVVSCNLPIARQIVGTMATRTTHPLALRRLGELLARAPGPVVEVGNPYAWLTKTEVVSKLGRYGAEGLIDTSISCTNVYHRSNRLTHCGACSQCLDRRFAILAAGLAEHDDAGHYATEVMTDAREKDLSQTMSLAWTEHALDIPTDVTGFYAKFGSEMPRLVDGFPDLPAVEIEKAIVDLHREHSDCVRRALETALDAARGDLVEGRVPPTALLRMIMGRRDGAPEAIRSEIEAHGRAPAAGREVAPAGAGRADRPWPAQIEVVSDDCSPIVRLLGLDEFRGNDARLILALRARHEEDSAARLPKNEWRSTSVHELMDVLGLDDEAHVRQIVRRLRRGVADALAAHDVEDVGAEPLVHTRRPGGYLLDPLAVFVETRRG